MRAITLRRADRCAACGTELAAGSRAAWDAAARTVTCLACLPPAENPIDRGQAGASVARTYQRRADRYQKAEQGRVEADRVWRETVKEEHPVLGRFAAAITPKAEVRAEPAHIRSWNTGTPGERRVGEVLDGIDGIVALHDRRIPGRTANIDHVAVCPNGVWVIDAKRYLDKKVEYRDAGGWFRTDERLLVGGRDRTKLVDAMTAQVEAVCNVLTKAGMEVTVRPMLCFVGSTWSLFAEPFMCRGVAVAWPLSLPELLRRPGPSEAETMDRLARTLADALPPA
jgi:hypothetical protein